MKPRKCPSCPIEIPEDREVVFCDAKEHPRKPDRNGYFLVKVENGMICCGFVRIKGSKHRMAVEFRGRDPDKMIKEIAERKICSLVNMGYIASELMTAKDALENGKRYVQR